MRIAPSIYAAACLLTTATAFYPYKPNNSPDNPNTKTPRRNFHELDSRPLTLPLRRVPTRRDNNYNIVNSKAPTQKDSAAIDQDGPDFSYMVGVKLGESEKEYHLLLDTAASNTWVMAEGCKTLACGTHNTFGSSDSGSLKTDSTPFSIEFGTGTVSGNIGTDILRIAGLSPTLSFGIATNVSDEFHAYPMDGILGLGRGDTRSNTIEAPSLLGTLSSSRLIEHKLFGIHLSRGVDGLDDGELNLGGPNTNRYGGDLSWNEAVDNENGYWEIAISDAGFDDKATGLEGRTAVLDSGTSYILMPSNDALVLHGLIPGFKQSEDGETFTIPCSTTQPVQIKFGDTIYNVSTKDYIGGSVGSGNCASNIVGRQVFGDTQWLVGDVFLKNVYSVFDADNSQVGFGVKEEFASSSTSSSMPSSTATITKVVSATASPIIPPSGSTVPTAANQNSPQESQPAKGESGRVKAPPSSFALLVALGLLSVFV